MDQLFRTHRQYQLLEWIDALENGFGETDDTPPTVSNLAYYLFQKGDYRDEFLEEKFSWLKTKGTPDDDVFRFLKRDLTRHLGQYDPSLFADQSVKKAPSNHITLSKRVETREVESTAYFLSEHGKKRLDRLRSDIDSKRELIKSKTINTAQKDNITFTKTKYEIKSQYRSEISGIQKGDIEIDSIAIPVQDRVGFSWNIKYYKIPRIKIITHNSKTTPKIQLDR